MVEIFRVLGCKLPRRALVYGVLLSMWLRAPAAGAAPALSAYEQESLQEGLRRAGAQLESNPSGKTVEGVDVVALEVIEERDPAPNLLNLFHWTTHDDVIRREVLLRVGDGFDQRRLDETARNLRNLPQLSVVLVTTTRGSTEGAVRLLIVTKDVWSLRVSWEPSFYNGNLTGLELVPTEVNVFGTGQSVELSTALTSHTFSAGVGYYVPRVAGSRIGTLVRASAVMNCGTGAVEGGGGDFSYYLPLYSAERKWAWATRVTVSDVTARPLSTGYSFICSNPPERRAYFAVSDARSQSSTPGDPNDVRLIGVPYRYRSERLRGQFALTRSFNLFDKFNVSFGAEVEQHARAALPVRETEFDARFGPDPGTGPALPEIAAPDAAAGQVSEADRAQALAAWNAQLQATRDRRVSPYVQLRAYSARYLKTTNYYTLGLQEDIQVGHDVYLRVYPAFRPISTRSLLGLFTGASYTAPLLDGFARLALSGTFEFAAAGREDTPERVSGPSQSRAELNVGAQLATPDLGLGRLVSNFWLLYHPLRYQETVIGLGSSSLLRGYIPNAFRGYDLISINTEFRSRPIELWSVLLGLNLFYDVGDTPEHWYRPRLHHGIGAGLRILFPQLNRDVFRVDVALPLGPDATTAFTFTAGFKQVFGAPSPRPDVLIAQ